MQSESVWDYPRPPAVEKSDRRIRIVLNGVDIVDTDDAIRILETSHPPTYYVPSAAVSRCDLIPDSRRTFCEFKGVAHYYDVVVGDRAAKAAAWFYPTPSSGYEQIKDYVNHLFEDRKLSTSSVKLGKAFSLTDRSVFGVSYLKIEKSVAIRPSRFSWEPAPTS